MLKKTTLAGEQYIKGFSNKRMLVAKRGIVAEEQAERWKISMKDVAKASEGQLGKNEAKKLAKEYSYTIKDMTRTFKEEIKQGIIQPPEKESVKKIKSKPRDEQSYWSKLKNVYKDTREEMALEKEFRRLGSEIDQLHGEKSYEEVLADPELKKQIDELNNQQEAILDKLVATNDFFKSWEANFGKPELDNEGKVQDISNQPIKEFNKELSTNTEYFKKLSEQIIKFSEDLDKLPDFEGKEAFRKETIDKMSSQIRESQYQIGKTKPLKGVMGGGNDTTKSIMSGLGLGKLTKLSTVAGLAMGAIALTSKAIKKTIDMVIGNKFSGYMKASLQLWDTAINMAFKPLADSIGLFLIPIMLKMLRYFSSADWQDLTTNISEWIDTYITPYLDPIMQALQLLGLIGKFLWDLLVPPLEKIIGWLYGWYQTQQGVLQSIADLVWNVFGDSIISAGKVLFEGLVYLATWLDKQLIPTFVNVGIAIKNGMLSILAEASVTLYNYLKENFNYTSGRLLDLSSWAKGNISEYQDVATDEEWVQAADEFISATYENVDAIYDQVNVLKEANRLAQQTVNSNTNLQKSVEDNTQALGGAEMDAQTKDAISRIYGSGERNGFTWVSTDSYSGWERTRAVGGLIPSDGVYYLHAGENVQTVNQTKSGGGTTDTINVKISAQGMTSVDNTMANKIANQTVTQLMANQTLRSGVRLNASRG
jgi:hypothetical protein